MIIGTPSLSTVAALLLAVSVDAGPIEYDTSSISQDSNAAAPWGKIKNLVVFGDR